LEINGFLIHVNSHFLKEISAITVPSSVNPSVIHKMAESSSVIYPSYALQPLLAMLNTLKVLF